MSNSELDWSSIFSHEKAAERLAVDSDLLQRAASAGAIRCARVGSHFVFSKSHIQDNAPAIRERLDAFANAERKHLLETITAPRRPSLVYFIRAEGTDYVKIGVSFDGARRRCRQLQVASPHLLSIVAVIELGDTQLEASLHRRFKHLRVLGEWFREADDLAEYIASLAPYVPPASGSPVAITQG